MDTGLFSIAGFVFTFFGIKFLLKWLKQKQILDVPNERSSHQTPTPVGGGLVIVIVTLSLYFIFLSINEKEIPWSYFGGAILISIISWLDDLYSVPVILRFISHSAATLLVILASGINNDLYLPFSGVIHLGNFAYIVWFLWIVWFINAYNFMDGIDGIAGIQAVNAGFAWSVISYLQGFPDVGTFGLIIAFSGFGFLILNWQPAKIFMGDVGSAFLGYTFAVFPLLLDGNKESSTVYYLVTAVLFVSLFVFDTVITFFTRLLKGEPVWKAHRSHLYQKLTIKGYSHQKVSLVYGLLTLGIILLTVLNLYLHLLSETILYCAVGIIGLVLYTFTNFFKNNSLIT